MTDDTNATRLTIYPADTPENVACRPNLLRQYYELEDEVWEQLKRNRRFPRIIFDPLEDAAEDDDVLIQKIRTPQGELSVVSLTHHNWGRVNTSLHEMRFMAMAYEADVLIRRQPTGHVAISHQPGVDSHFAILREMLRAQEQRLHLKRRTTPYDKLGWRYIEQDGLLINGDFTDLEAELPARFEPTLIQIDWIRDMLHYVLDRRRFYRTRSHDCVRGVCTSRSHDACPLRPFGLPQCMTLIKDSVNNRARDKNGGAA